jgi:hypothetical protein
MANIRASAVVVPVLAAAISAGTVSASQSVHSVTATPYAQGISVSVFLVPLRVLEEQSVFMSDFRALSVGTTVIEVATATEDVAITTEKALTDSVTMVETAFRAINSTIDFDPNDPDADPDPIFIAEADAKSLEKPFANAVAAADTDVKAIGKAESDSVSAAETINTKDVGKSLTDTPDVTDAITEFNTAKVLVDTAEATEATAKELTRPDVADAVTAADESSRSPGLGKTDAVTAADTFGPFSIGTNPSDTVTAADEVNAFEVAKVLTEEVTITDFVAKTPAYEFDFDTVDADADPDPVTVADTPVWIIEPVYADSVTGNDALVNAVNKALAHAVTTTDVINVLLTLGQSNPLYDWAFISDDKFTYFPVPGTINSHLIHQPLINGEFVLTVDPNAGIVYTIRTESEYTFAGYQINGNQLN